MTAVEIEKKIELLKIEIDKSLISTNNDRKRYKRNSLTIFSITTILSVVITVILGLDLYWNNNVNNSNSSTIKIIVLIINNIVTMLTTFDIFFQNKSLWLSNNECRNNLQELKLDIIYAESHLESITIDQVDVWKKEYQKIINIRNHNWNELRSKSVNEI